MINCFKQHYGNYGRIRLRKSLLKEGTDISEYRIAGILKANRLQAKSGRKTTGRRNKQPTEQQYHEENLVKDKFATETINKLWCSDITELRCRSRKIYVCGVIDVASRKIVGWSVSKLQTQSIVQEAFRMAIGRNPEIAEEAIFHSDRGCQYTARKTKELIETSGFKKSMSRPGRPNDNQPIESFWMTMEREMEDIRNMKYEEAKRAIVNYIELYYNSARLHSGINYQIPNEYVTASRVHQS